MGVLTGSAAEKYLTTRLGERIEIVELRRHTDAMREVETHKLDATLQDTPAAAIFYRSRFPALSSRRGSPVGRGYYVIYARKGDTELVRAMNEALVRADPDGNIEWLYRAYGIWDEAQRELSRHRPCRAVLRLRTRRAVSDRSRVTSRRARGDGVDVAPRAKARLRRGARLRR